MAGDVSETLLSIRTEGISARGRAELIKFYSGRRVTPLQAIRAKCYDCMGYYVDGKRDCGQTDCPLHRFMPYNPGAAEDPDDQSALEDAGDGENR